jgi:hypothetical protein
MADHLAISIYGNLIQIKRRMMDFDGDGQPRPTTHDGRREISRVRYICKTHIYQAAPAGPCARRSDILPNDVQDWRLGDIIPSSGERALKSGRR